MKTWVDVLDKNYDVVETLEVSTDLDTFIQQNLGHILLNRKVKAISINIPISEDAIIRYLRTRKGKAWTEEVELVV